MPRKPREFYKGGIWHIINRGIETIFRERQDYNFYLYTIKEVLKKYPIDIYAYNLLPKHIHYLVGQSSEIISPDKFFTIAHKKLSSYINYKYSKTGHLFKDRPKVKSINNNDYLLSVSFYVNLNEVLEKLQNIKKKTVSKEYLGKLLEDSESNSWSSYPVYLGSKKDNITKTEFILSLLSDDIKKARTKYKKLAKEFITSGYFLKTRDLKFE